MGQPITVTLSDTLLDELQRVASLRHEDLSQVVEELLAQALPASRARIHTTNQANGQQNYLEQSAVESELAVDPEVAAYYALHPMLWKMYPHQYVALHQGKLVDHDTDGFALSLRIYQHYPDQFVLIRQVEEQAETILRIRSPRFIENSL